MYPDFLKSTRQKFAIDSSLTARLEKFRTVSFQKSIKISCGLLFKKSEKFLARSGTFNSPLLGGHTLVNGDTLYIVCAHMHPAPTS